MKKLALVVALFSMPAFAGEYSSWANEDGVSPAAAMTQLAQQKDSCCKHCTKGKPCGNSCIAAGSKCKQPPGCAC